MALKDLVKKKRETDFYFFSGKGGVGKTSASAATALWLSQKQKKKVLVISVDPAHSLSDSVEMKIGHEVKKLKNNLYGLEIDPKKAVAEYKERFSPQLEKIEFLKGAGLEDMFDMAGMTPGIDEIAAFDKFLHYMNSDDYDVIIFDTAPTGHALRFLSLPDVLDSWIGKMIKLRMKFSGMVGIFKKLIPFAEDQGNDSMGTEQLDAMKERIQEANKLLSDPKRTHFNIVMIPENMSIFESERLIGTLKEYNIPVNTIIINQLIPDNPTCKFCTEKRKIQQERVKLIKEKFKGLKILEMSLFKEEVTGFDMLEKAAEKLYS
ncbi:MAG: TRC40/GET3/ArsA family transport-energizing ATPase [Candidatus Aenigmatarchaeota archaeon]